MATCAICGQPVTTGVVIHRECLPVWISVEDQVPDAFVSVLGAMSDAGEFPPVRECYIVGDEFFFPGLNEFHPVHHWTPLPAAPEVE